MSRAVLPPFVGEPDIGCRDADPEEFFPGTGQEGTAARKLCGPCPHRWPCLAWALATHERFGIWGGTTGRERERILARRPT